MTLRPKSPGSVKPGLPNRGSLNVGINTKGRVALGGFRPNLVTKPWRPRNGGYANKLYAIKDGILRRRFGKDVPFTKDGCPDFSQWQHRSVPNGVQIRMRGNHRSDYKAALAAAHLKRTPKGWTWHHHQNMRTMQLVPTRLHDHVKHSGGVSRIKHIQRYGRH